MGRPIQLMCHIVIAALALAAPGFVKAADTAGAPSVWTLVNDNDAAVSYSPHMEQQMFPEYYNGDAHTPDKPGEWCEFLFTGTGVKWIGGKNGDHGEVDVYSDGRFDATINTMTPGRLNQQELFVKTGLRDGAHTLKIVVKTAGYQDFDAFAYLALPLRQAGPPQLGSFTLPAQRPYLNRAHRYPVGNGLVAAVCGPTGQWEQLAGPGYTTPNFIAAENLELEVDGVELPLRVDMKRAEKTGVFYGTTTRGDLDVCLIDYTDANQPWITRLIVIDNTSATVSHDVHLLAHVAPLTGHGYTNWLVSDAAGHPCGLAIQADTSIGDGFGGNNITDKSVTIAFADPAASASCAGGVGILETPPVRLAPRGRFEAALQHYFRQGHGMPDRACVTALRGLDNLANLKEAVARWQAWFDQVGPGYRLENIKDERTRQLVEGALMVLKTNQSQDGGLIAHTTFYKEGFVRDAATAVLGLLATGHIDEAKQWLRWINYKLSIHGHLGDAMNCEASLTDKNYSMDFGNPDVEEPGWVLLCARDYYDETHDLATLRSLDRTLRYCMDIQLQTADANGDKMEFNGDETEICGAVELTSTGWPRSSISHRGQSAWSLSSVAMAAASLDFYIQYVKLCGDDPANYHNAQANTTMNLHTELTNLVSAMDRDFWRTDVPGAPGGFHDFFRLKSDGSWPKARLANLTLMPVFFGTPYAADEKAKDVAAIAQLFDARHGFLQLVPSANNGMEGHDLGYLLWGLVETGDWRKDAVYHALVNGPTVDCWGSFNEAYDSNGNRNDHDLRSLETGINVSALAKYWGLGSAPK